jgi:hypothetical protein
MAIRFLDKPTVLADIENLPNAAGIGTLNGVTYINADGTPRALAQVVKKAREWFVDASEGGSGDDANSGRSWDEAFLTMTYALTQIRSGDIIYFAGKLTEQVTTPVQIFDVTIVGAGNRPRHADSDPENGDFATNTWKYGTDNTTPLVKVMQQGWRFVNILFQGGSTMSNVLLFRDGGSGDDERDAGHAEFYNCRFSSGANGIEESGGCGHVGIYGCYFTDLTGVALKRTPGATVGQSYFRWDVRGNRFQDCPSLTTATSAQFFRFMENTVSFAGAPTLGFDFNGDAKQNQIINNVFNVPAGEFDPAGGFTGTATDNWSNILEDAIETGLPAN